MSMNVVEASGLSKRYGGTWALRECTLAIPAGHVAALVGALAVYLLITGLQIHHAYAAVTACRPASSFACGDIAENFNNTYGVPANAIAALLQAVPALIGAFAGAPVLARELETGTFRYAWTQGFGRTRWTVAKLVPLAIVVTAAAWAFSVLFSWYFHPFFADGNQITLDPEVFDLRGVAFATQPATRLWAFQWIEGGWLLALSVLLIAATVWLVRRRAT